HQRRLRVRPRLLIGGHLRPRLVRILRLLLLRRRHLTPVAAHGRLVGGDLLLVGRDRMLIGGDLGGVRRTRARPAGSGGAPRGARSPAVTRLLLLIGRKGRLVVRHAGGVGGQRG